MLSTSSKLDAWNEWLVLQFEKTDSCFVGAGPWSDVHAVWTVNDLQIKKLIVLHAAEIEKAKNVSRFWNNKSLTSVARK